MSEDRIVRLLADLEDFTPPVRPAFAAALREELCAELGFPAASEITRERVTPSVRAGTAAEPAGGPLRRFLGSLWPATPRVVLVAAAALLLLAGTVVAGAVVLRSWLTTGPRGIQYSNEFTMTEVYREPGGLYTDFQLAPDGSSALALRSTWTTTGVQDPANAAIVRFPITADGWAAPEVVLPLGDLRDPALWDAGVDLSEAAVVRAGSIVEGDMLSVAPNGDLFVGVTAMEGFGSGGQEKHVGDSLVTVRPDGSTQKVVTGGELQAAGVLPAGTYSYTLISGVPSGPGVVWGRVQAWSPSMPNGDQLVLFQAVDPNADGDWSDRVVRPLVLPATVPQLDPTTWEWRYGAFVAEPSIGGRDRSRSILLPFLSRAGEYRVYRLTDTDLDGDATDPGEVELVATAEREASAAGSIEDPLLATRVVTDGPDVVLDELVVARLTRETRISRLTAGGVVDVVRALPHPAGGIVATPDGNIYVASREPGNLVAEAKSGTQVDLMTFVVNRLTPVPVEAGTSGEPAGAAAGGPGGAAATAAPAGSPSSPSPSWSPAPDEASLVDLGPVTPGVPRLAAWVMEWDGPRNQLLALGADGSGPAEIVPGRHNQMVCQSPDGSRMVFFSDEEVPNEPFLYLANADGTGVRKVSEEAADGLMCPSVFADGALLLASWGDPQRRVVRYDLATGETSELGTGLVPLGLSPDGRRLAVLLESARDTLQVLDPATGRVEPLAGPFAAGQEVRSASWSPDGSRMALVVGPPEGNDSEAIGDLQVLLVDVPGGASREVLRHHGRVPDIAWSADGSQLTIRRRGEAELGLDVVDTATGAARTVAEGPVIFAGWSPVDPATFAYATEKALFLVGPSGEARQLAAAPAVSLCPDCEEPPPAGWPQGWWLGWSPDGSLIGTGGWDVVVALVDVATGEIKVAYRQAPGTMLISYTWWR